MAENKEQNNNNNNNINYSGQQLSELQEFVNSYVENANRVNQITYNLTALQKAFLESIYNPTATPVNNSNQRRP